MFAMFMAISVAMSAQTEHAKRIDAHVGLFGGSAAGKYNEHYTDGTDTEDFDLSYSGGRVGVQGGVDFNVHHFVVGALADWSWSNARTNYSESEDGTKYETFAMNISQLSTVRGRVGRRYHRVLPYVHGGLVVADTRTSAVYRGNTEFNNTVFRPGYVVGAGLEYALAHRLSFVTEYGYNHVGNIPMPSETFDSTSQAASETATFSTVTAGVNYHF